MVKQVIIALCCIALLGIVGCECFRANRKQRRHPLRRR